MSIRIAGFNIVSKKCLARDADSLKPKLQEWIGVGEWLQCETKSASTPSTQRALDERKNSSAIAQLAIFQNSTMK